MIREMKDSGVEWIGEIPLEWKTEKIKNILKFRNESNKPVVTKNILSLTNSRGVIPYSEKGDIGNKSKDNIEGYKLAYENDIVINSMNLKIGSVGKSNYFGAVSPVYYMLYSDTDKVDIDYVDNIFQIPNFQKYVGSFGNGIMDIRLKVSVRDLNNIELPIPNIIEQKRINAFLYSKTSEIDSLISNTEKSIELLKEYKQSLITETVTKGLDPNVTMKDSEVEWIGEIPEHWSTHKLKNIVVENLQYGSNNSGINFDNNNPRYIRITDIDENGNLYETNKQSLKIDNSNKYLLEENDILFARSGATVGKTYIHKNYYGLCAFAGYLVRAKINSNNNPNFVYYFTKSEIFEKWINIVKTKATIENVSADKYNELIIPLPIKKEQDDIVLFLNNKLKKVNNIIVYKNEILSELIRYKQSLIYEYVTGKKEVPDGY